MLGSVLHAALMSALLACQQAERREASGEVAVTLPVRPAPIPTTDPDVRAAQMELADGRPSRASRLVMPVLHVPARRTPEALLVAARAAAEWHGWDLVNAMLAYEPWLSGRFGGEGLELLARSALERGQNEDARRYAEGALRVATDPGSRAVRLVLLARAFDRRNVRDSAALMYHRAADALPVVREWLLLRSAGATDDPEAREKLYAGIRATAAKARIPYTEAQTLERFGKELAAADAYEKLGDMPSAYRLRIAAADAPLRSGLRAGLLGYIQRDARGDNLARALEVLDAAFPALDATSQVLVTRRVADAGLSARAASGFARVPANQLTDADVIAWARALLATGKPLEAMSRLAARKFAPAAAAQADYLRALAMVRSGRTTAARAALQRLVSARASTGEAADALFLLADLESDAGRDRRARDLFQQSCTHRAAGTFSDEACFRAGVLSFALGDARRATSAFDELPKRFPSSDESLAATYWAGRAWERAGNGANARARWTAVTEKEPLSYYASAAARRLGAQPWTPAPAELQASPLFQNAMTRAAVLEYLGMDTEARYEYEGVEADASAQPALALGAGAALLERGQTSRAIKLGWRAVAGRPARDTAAAATNGDPRGYALVYPMLREVELIARARENNLDPAVVAGVIRQESSWNPQAVSRAGARGLMQIMPTVGRAIAQARRYPMWDPALLFDPDVSLELGTSHLSAAVSEYRTALPRALAAYNAGSSRVRRWSRRVGASDPELFVEQIPFVETRDYVRIVMRNTEMYRALHQLRR